MSPYSGRARSRGRTGEGRVRRTGAKGKGEGARSGEGAEKGQQVVWDEVEAPVNDKGDGLVKQGS